MRPRSVLAAIASVAVLPACDDPGPRRSTCEARRPGGRREIEWAELMRANHLDLLAIWLAAMLAGSPAAAHSVPELEGALSERERYFQPLQDRAAPGFTLQDAAGRAVGRIASGLPDDVTTPWLARPGIPRPHLPADDPEAPQSAGRAPDREP